MIKLIPIIDQDKDGEVGGRTSGKQQHSAIRSAIKKIKHDELDMWYNHFTSGGFIRRGETIVYFSAGDFRHFNNSAYARYATSFKDYTGGANNHTTIKELDVMIEKLLSAKEV